MEAFNELKDIDRNKYIYDEELEQYKLKIRNENEHLEYQQYDVNNYPYYPNLEPGTVQVDREKEIKYREEILQEMHMHARNDIFFKPKYVIPMARFIDDDDVVVDIENFSFKEYIKFLLFQPEKCTEKDDFPRTVLFIMLTFFVNLFAVEVFWIGYIYKDLLNEGQNEAIPETKMVKKSVEGSEIYVKLDDQTYNFTQKEMQLERFAKRINEIKKEQDQGFNSIQTE